MKELNLRLCSIIIVFSHIFMSNSVNALNISASLKGEGKVTFTVKNDSGSEIQLNLGQFHRENLFLSIGYGKQVVLKENWIPESSNYRIGVLEVDESISFDIDLNKRFGKLRQFLKTECLFLFWGGIFNIGDNEHVAKSGSVVLNSDVCVASPSNEQFW